MPLPYPPDPNKKDGTSIVEYLVQLHKYLEEKDYSSSHRFLTNTKVQPAPYSNSHIEGEDSTVAVGTVVPHGTPDPDTGMSPMVRIKRVHGWDAITRSAYEEQLTVKEIDTEDKA